MALHNLVELNHAVTMRDQRQHLPACWHTVFVASMFRACVASSWFSTSSGRRLAAAWMTTAGYTNRQPLTVGDLLRTPKLNHTSLSLSLVLWFL